MLVTSSVYCHVSAVFTLEYQTWAQKIALNAVCKLCHNCYNIIMHAVVNCDVSLQACAVKGVGSLW